jgi:hypothetical protein
MRFIPFLICLLSALYGADYAFPGNSRDMGQTNQLLDAELALARKPGTYFVFDLGERTVFIKARGVVLRELRVSKVRLWGRPISLEARELSEKSSLFKPKRKEIKSGKKAGEGEFEIEALELKDMPFNFKLVFTEGVMVSVRKEAEGIFSWLTSAGHYLAWLVSRPPLTVWYTLREKPFRSVLITMSEKDAQSLYWALYEGIDGIIVDTRQ